MKQNLINAALNDNIELEISEKKYQTADINTLNQELKSFEVSDITLYIIKAIKNGKCVSLQTEDIKNPDSIIDNINTMLEISDNDNRNSLSKGNISNLLRDKEELDYNQVKEDILSLNKEIKEKFKEVVNIETMYSHYTNGYYIENKNALLEDECFYNQYAASITVANNNINRIAYVSVFTKKYDLNKLREQIYENIKSLLIKLNSDSVKTNKYNIILKNSAVASILNTFTEMFNSKAIDLKESVLNDKFNKRVFSDQITIVEDPNGDDTIIKRAFDTEGVKTSYKEIVKDGVFIKKINNLEYAIKNNEEATGNAYGVNNLYIKAGNSSFDDLVKKLDNGIIIDEVIGLHAGVDTRNGNISLQAEGLLVESGKITKGLNMIILSTNIKELLGNVIEVGNDLKEFNSTVSSPSLLLDNITISGSEE